jgi:hypothetical protein
MLVFSAIARSEPNLRQRIVDAGLFGDLGELRIVVERPVRALLDVRRRWEPNKRT